MNILFSLCIVTLFLFSTVTFVHATDTFDNGSLYGWKTFGEPGYSLSNDNGLLLLSGAQAAGGNSGMYKQFYISFNHEKTSTLSFDWRASAIYYYATYTPNFHLHITDKHDRTILQEKFLVDKIDTGIRSYSKDITSIVSGLDDYIIIYVYLRDVTIPDHKQKIWIDNVELTTVRPSSVMDDISLSNSLKSLHDTFGNLFGMPLAFFIIIFIAAVFTPKNAQIGTLIIGFLIAIMVAFEIIAISAEIFGLIVVLIIHGLFAGKKSSK